MSTNVLVATTSQLKSRVEGKAVRKERVETVCLECGKVELRLPCYANRKFCDRKCSTKYNNRKKAVARETRTCPVCEAQFEVRVTEKKVCCSPACGSQHKKKTFTLVCEECGEEYERHYDRYMYSRWCSNKCRNSGTKQNGMAPMSEEHYSRLLEEQGGKCAICDAEFAYTRTNRYGEKNNVPLLKDHCHESMTWRGLLCMNCNTGLGMFKDNVEELEKAIEYLRKWGRS